MFKRLQWKLTFFYTLILILMLIVANVSIYALLESTNKQRLSDEITQLLSAVEGSQWLSEENDLSEDESEEDHLEVLFEEQKVSVPEKEEISEDEKDSDHIEELEEPDEPDEPDEKDEPDEPDEEDEQDEPDEVGNNGGIVLMSKVIASEVKSEVNEDEYEEDESLEILIPTTLQQYPYYTIHNTDGRLLDYRRPNKTVGNALYPYDQALSVDATPELIRLDDDVYYIMAKTSIVIEGKLYGTATVAENVSLAFDTLDQLLNVMIIFTVIGSLIAFLIGYILSGRVIKPIQEAYKLKEDFIGNASHEFRTPLSIIQLSMDVLKREKSMLSELGQDTLEDVEDETHKMGQLVDKLLFVARNDANNLVIDEEVVDLTKLIEENKSNYTKIAELQNITIHMDTVMNYKVLGDQKMLDSVVSTILDNAIKYNKKNGDIYITVDMKIIKHQQMVEFAVKDTGIGIPTKDHEQIFERFHRQDSSRSKEKEGYGLGLSIAKDIVLAHSGHIYVESEEGQYTKVITQLPLI